MGNPFTTSSDGNRFGFVMHCADSPAMPEDVARLNDECEAFMAEAGADPGEINVVQIAVEELLTNLAKFDAGVADLTAEGAVVVGEQEIIFTLADNGSPFDPSRLPPPSLDGDVAEREIGGLGLYMLFEMFTRHRYERAGDRNRSVWTLARESAR